MAGAEPKRYGKVIYIKPEKLKEYKALHANAWPKVLERLEKSNVRNFTIYYCKELGALFSHFEYIGNDYEKDMEAIGTDEDTIKWWKVCEPCQKPLVYDGSPPSEGGKGDWWQPMEEVFHDGHFATSFK